jgi:hypothetical protein
MSAGAGRSPAVSGGMGGGGAARPAASAGARPAAGTGARPAAGAGAAARPATGAGGATRPAAGAGAAARPATGARTTAGTGARPSAGQLNNFLDVPSASTGAVRAGGGARQGAGGGAAADFLQGGGAAASQLPARSGVAAAAAAGAGVGAAAAARPGVGAGAAAARGQNLSNNRATRVENRQQLQDNRVQRRDEVRNQVAENHPRLDFWSNYPNWAAWRINRPYRWATWGALGGWIGWGAGEPTSYSYGDNVYYQDDQVYYGDQSVATAEQYAQQADQIVAGAPPTTPENSEWMPLGVFALTQDNQASGTEPTLFMQLAISKEGVIAGTFQNMETGQAQKLEGMADKKSQRVAWGISGQQRPILETGIANLTQDSSPALIHFADGQTQQWLLVRLPEPKQQ